MICNMDIFNDDDTVNLTDYDNLSIEQIITNIKTIKNNNMKKYNKIINEKPEFKHITELNISKKCGSYVNQCAMNGWIELLIYLHEKGYKFDESTILYATQNGYFDCLRYIITSNINHGNKCSLNGELCEWAARNGDFNCLKYLHENGCPFENSLWYCVTTRCNLDCFKYLYENGCHWRETMIIPIVSGNHLDCLKYLHEKNCKFDEQMLRDYSVAHCREYVKKMNIIV